MRAIGVVVALLTSVTAHGGYFRVVTGQAGAQVQLDATHTQYYLITPTDLVGLAGPDFILGGQFEMKAGPSTNADLQINLWSFDAVGGPPPPVGGIALATRTFSYTEFCNQLADPGDCNNYHTHVLDFFAPQSLDQTVTYYLELKSLPPPGPQNSAFFIKRQGNTFSYQDSPIGPIPEPSTIGLTALGLAAVLRFHKRR